MEHTWMYYIPHLISTLALLLLLVEQVLYLRKKRFLPGPTLVLPFFGNALSMVASPTRFWDRQSAYAKSTPLGISSNYILGRHILYIYSTDLSHKVFANVRPDAFHLVGHPFGKKLFGDHNLIYMFGQPHRDLRRRIAPNFAPAALHTYTRIQHRIILRHLAAWCARSGGEKPVPLRLLCRDMNLETSQAVFVGPYLDGPARARFNSDYNFFNVGLMRLPVDFPGFAFRDARLAVGRLVGTLSGCAAESERRMKKSNNNNQPTCLIDFWMLENLREFNEKPDFDEIGGHLFDFLFASQDASTSALLWAVVFLDSHPEVLGRVRDEVAGCDVMMITGEELRGMRYTEAVAREVVRIRAPATMVPHVAGADFRLTEGYTVPKGTIVFPSVYDSCFQGFTEPERFDPERFMEGRQEDRVYRRNYLAFGAGAHQCVGQRYAIDHLKLFIAMLVSLVDFRRERTEGCDEIAYVPTIVPRDDCRVLLSPRRGGGPFPTLSS